MMISTLLVPPPKRSSRAARAGRLACLAAPLLLTACGVSPTADRWLGLVTPYRMDIVQGNAITREQVAAVRPGMSKAQVRDILGSPMISDTFNASRWDYAFTIRRQGAEPQRRHVVATFEGDRLKSLSEAEVPSEREFVALIADSRRKIEPRVLELTEEQRKALPPPVRREAATPAATAASGPPRSFPPLEPQ
jgi:outer membrane protein assembly factor BamE